MYVIGLANVPEKSKRKSLEISIMYILSSPDFLLFDLLTSICPKLQNYQQHSQINSNYHLICLMVTKWPQKCILTIFYLIMTLTFGLLTSKSNQFISVPKCNKTVNLMKSSKLFTNYHANKDTYIHEWTHRHTD